MMKRGRCCSPTSAFPVQVVLSASAYLRGGYPCELYIDLKPALSAEALDRRCLRDFSENANRDFINALDALLPQKLIAPFVSLTGIDPRKKVHEITREERRALLQKLKALHLTITSPRPIAEGHRHRRRCRRSRGRAENDALEKGSKPAFRR